MHHQDAALSLYLPLANEAQAHRDTNIHRLYVCYLLEMIGYLGGTELHSQWTAMVTGAVRGVEGERVHSCASNDMKNVYSFVFAHGIISGLEL